MPYSQRDIVMLEKELPDGTRKEHPFLIITPAFILQHEPGYYTGLMMSGTSYTDKFTFPTSPEMFETPLSKEHTQIRLQIITSFRDNDIRRLKSRMNRIDFVQVLKQLRDKVIVAD